jgi:hypothetical protein
MILTTEEKELIIYCLSLRKNYIETGNINLSSVDIVNMKREGCKNLLGEVKALSLDQMKLLIQISELQEKITREY